MTKHRLALAATGVIAAVLTCVPMANAAELTATQQAAILGLLSSFGASASTIANVQAALGGTVSAGATIPVTSVVTPAASTNPSGGPTTTSSSCTALAPVGLGASGTSVTCLQLWLMSHGYSIPAGATGTFGSETKQAVTEFQTAAGLPATGYFGSMSVGAAGGSTSTNVSASSSSSVSTTATLNADMDAISNEQTGLTSDLSQSATVSSQNDTVPQ